MSKDPIGFSGGDGNLYRYGNSNPVSYIDPSGLAVACYGGTVVRAGWQNPSDHGYGLGFRITIQGSDGNYEQYGHMDPSTTPAVGSTVRQGDYVGDYASPTNGRSSGPHLHYERRNSLGEIINPGNVIPIPGGRVTTPWEQIDGMHPTPHQGIDMVNP